MHVQIYYHIDWQARKRFLAKIQCKSHIHLMFDNKKVEWMRLEHNEKNVQKLKWGEKKVSKHATHTDKTLDVSKRMKAWSSNTSASSAYKMFFFEMAGSQSARQTNRHQDTHEKDNRKKKKKKKKQKQQQQQTRKN